MRSYEPTRLVLVGDSAEQTRLVDGWIFIDNPFMRGGWDG